LNKLQDFQRYVDLERNSDPLGEINTTPLVDVMLVLLIIFLITVPVINSSIKVKLPEELSNINLISNSTIAISITKQRQFFLNGTPVESKEELFSALNSLSLDSSPRDIQLFADKTLLFSTIDVLVQELRDLGFSKFTYVVRP
jgi:biopolymer transport protein ExbD